MTTRALLFVMGSLVGAFGAHVLGVSPGASGESFPAERSPGPEPNDRLAAPASADVSAEPAPTASSAERALEESMARDSTAALLEAAAIREPTARRRAVMRLGALWARSDPEAALRQAYRLPPVLKADFEASVSSEWANLNAAQFLTHAASVADPAPLMAGLRLLIATDPARVLAIASRLPRETDNVASGGLNALERAALSALAVRDSAAAFRYAEPMLPSINLNLVVQDVVTRFARTDPDAAVAWLGSLDAATSTHVSAVIAGIAGVDIMQALRLAAAETAAFDTFENALATGALASPASAADAATHLLNDGSSLATKVLEQLAASWARQDPQRFTEWFLAHAASVSTPLVRSVASQYAAADLGAALGLVERLPAGMRSTWIEQVAGAYASRDPLGALDWIERYRGQPFYDDARSEIVIRAADANPQLAATMLDGLPPGLRNVAAPRIAAAMSARDPQAAADWAFGLDDRVAASAAVYRVVTDWLRRDVESAATWVLALEHGAVRDNALLGLIDASNGTGLDQRPIVAAIDSETTRREARHLAVWRQTGAAPEVERELLEAMLDDPDYGEWARERLATLDEPAD